MKGKFNSIRDEILYSVSLDGFDEVRVNIKGEAHCLLNIGMVDLPEIQRTMRYMYRSPSSVHYTACRECVGNFILTESSEGFVRVASYANHDLAMVAWDEIVPSLS